MLSIFWIFAELQSCKQLTSLLKGVKSGAVHFLDHDIDSRANWGALDLTKLVISHRHSFLTLLLMVS